MGNSVSLKFRGAQIWNKLPNVFKIIKHCTPFKKGAEAYAVFCIRYFSNTEHKSTKKKYWTMFFNRIAVHMQQCKIRHRSVILLALCRQN